MQARSRGMELKCPSDGVLVDMTLLKTLQKDSEILDFTKKYERYLQDIALENNLAPNNLEGAEYLRL